jgi:inosine-uridine nucleoside N-ribohydrolase
MTPIYLDTDIGDDIDDALALAVALNSPEVDLRGVTTVFRDARRRAVLARQLLGAFGREDVPVYAGHSKPLLQPYEAIPGGPNVGRQFERLDASLPIPADVTAIEALRDAIHGAAAEGEKLTVVAIGPLTNIALLLHLYPEVIPLCRVLIMGGKWNPATPSPAAEWNIICDPEAAAMVFRSGVELAMVGLDVTLQCVLTHDDVRRFREGGTERAGLLADLIDLWGHKVTLHDPLTVLTLFDECVRFEGRHIQVGLHGAQRGVTEVHHGGANCRVAVDVDAPRAIEVFMERVLK